MQMRQRFQSRTALMDEKIEDFLKIITELGGYFTPEQAKALGLANSDTRVLAHSRGLERAGFLRRVADYQLSTKSPERQPACLIGIAVQDVPTV